MPTDREALRAQILKHEGEVLHAYQDSLGYWTIGVGRLVDKRMGGGISHDEAMVLLDHDLDACVADLEARFTWFSKLDAIRQRALIDLRFNLGSSGLLQFKHLLAALEAGDFDAAAQALVASKWHGQVGARAARVEHMVRTGLDPDGQTA